MADELTIWFNPDCSKCRTVQGLLAERGVPATLVEYLRDTPSREELTRVLGLLGTDDPRRIMRVDEPLYAELGLAGAGHDALLDAVLVHPALLQRPIAVLGDRAVVARPADRVLELLD
jgi:arsenate reductase